ncbi:MAG: right-handed parallel beta-helix repeat-containing protein [Gemmatales bacterium]|nr:right-handed parallel beta-helix repeat-containing protein [Gemmatales bacterium]MDW8175108.1 right-handed parallel beta-helix repeat-containing protein [Gemmatales bacterium]
MRFGPVFLLLFFITIYFVARRNSNHQIEVTSWPIFEQQYEPGSIRDTLPVQPSIVQLTVRPQTTPIASNPQSTATHPRPPTTWTVDFTTLTLELAVRSAKAGDIIVLAAGRFTLKERITVDKPLSIRGAGRQETHLLSWEELFAIQFTGQGPWTLENLTIEHVGNARASVVVVDSGHILIRNCRFTGATFQKETPSPRGGCGLWFTGTARGLVINCTCDRNGSNGIEISGKAQMVLEGNTCESNNASGILYYEHAGGAARDNTCRNNGSGGIAVLGQAQPTLEGNTCEHNKESGIAYFDNAGGTARNNTCRYNEDYGIFVSKTARPVLGINDLFGNKLGDVGRD